MEKSTFSEETKNLNNYMNIRKEVQKKRKILQKEAVSVCNNFQVTLLPSEVSKVCFQSITINFLIFKHL